MQRFLYNLLAQGRVAKLLVVNNTTVQVIVEDRNVGAPALEGSTMDGVDGSGEPGKRWASANPNNAAVASGEPTYTFTIGSVEQV